jgi:hypothetical protein
MLVGALLFGLIVLSRQFSSRTVSPKPGKQEENANDLPARGFLARMTAAESTSQR